MPIRLQGQRLYILPTRHGYLFALVLLVMLLGSINYGNSLGFALTFLLGSLSMVSLLYTHRNLSRLEIHAGKTQAVFAGQRAVFTLCLSNPQGPDRYALGLHLPGQTTQLIDLALDHRHCLSVRLPTQQRGRLHLPRTMLFTQYPFGLAHAWTWIAPDMHCLVYPAPEAHAPAPPGMQSSQNGDRHSGRGTDDFSGLRAYQPGDSPRHIAWKRMPLSEQPLTKQFSGGGQADVWLNWQDTRDLATEQRLARLCRWVLECDNQSLRYGLHLPGIRIEPNQGNSHRQLCLSALALYPETP